MSWIGMDCVKGCGGSWTCDPEVGGAVGLRAAARAAEDSREAVSEKGGVARCRAWRMCLGILASLVLLAGGWSLSGVGCGLQRCDSCYVVDFCKGLDMVWWEGTSRVLGEVRWGSRRGFGAGKNGVFPW